MVGLFFGLTNRQLQVVDPSERKWGKNDEYFSWQLLINVASQPQQPTVQKNSQNKKWNTPKPNLYPASSRFSSNQMDFVLWC